MVTRAELRRAARRAVVLSSGSDGQGWIEVLDKILGSFDPHRDSNQTVGNSQLLKLLRT